MKHLRLFEYVDAVVKAGSIRRAAESLYITPSALDRRIQQIEEELGTQIFERHAKGMRLTAAGEIFLDYVRRHIADLDRVRSEIEGLKGLRQGHVSLVASQALAMDFLPHQIRAFRQRHPGVSFTVRIADRGEALKTLMAFEAELAIVVFPKMSSEMLQLIMIAQPVIALMSNRHPLASRDSVRLSECLNYPLVLPDASLGVRELLEPMLVRRTNKAQITAETNSFELMRGLLQDHQSIGFQIGISSTRAFEENTIVSLPIDRRDVPTVPLICAQLRGRTLSVAAARFADQLTHCLDEMDLAR
ncbi:LysR family transcriptional regulator [Vreelandella malpeensis]|uniref:LysR family transcriptional regulator n=1 Tax=Vreelandella malpeensis TaxID=1172368 RepID=A0ABS8DRV8_9GAMM|nr:LysR family transcriptional regulator [Halomonas malpeensis]MCB8888996.1 LysR family transcriptional regulator [Halomonas malpeensis]